MLVGERMTRDPVVIHDDTPMDEAMKIMAGRIVENMHRLEADTLLWPE